MSMLSAEENEFLTQTGPGTPMGDFVRRFWLPFLVADELVPDGPPLRVKLLGERLVAFRATDGRVGLVDEFCPHRRAPIFFGRNEEDGIRCVYHGWKFNLSGACVDMPSEPPDSLFKSKVGITAYQVREKAGVLWAYLGPAGTEGEIPHHEWMDVPDSHRYLGRWEQDFQLRASDRRRTRLVALELAAPTAAPAGRCASDRELRKVYPHGWRASLDRPRAGLRNLGNGAAQRRRRLGLLSHQSVLVAVLVADRTGARPATHDAHVGADGRRIDSGSGSELPHRPAPLRRGARRAAGRRQRLSVDDSGHASAAGERLQRLSDRPQRAAHADNDGDPWLPRAGSRDGRRPRCDFRSHARTFGLERHGVDCDAALADAQCGRATRFRHRAGRGSRRRSLPRAGLVRRHSRTKSSNASRTGAFNSTRTRRYARDPARVDRAAR